MSLDVLGVRVSPAQYDEVVLQILEWSKANQSRYVCAANVHSLMEAHDAADFREVLNAADLVVPDGMPLVWILRMHGQPHQQRVYGPALMQQTLRAAAGDRIPVGLYGSAPAVLDLLTERMVDQQPGVDVVFRESPPFRELSPEEDEEVCRRIDRSGTRILFVGLGCPKQERWMHAHRGRIAAVMLGVGAAFDFLAGTKRQAPRWMQLTGLEWLFRLLEEPRRLWKRYLYQNPRFVALAVGELLQLRSS